MAAMSMSPQYTSQQVVSIANPQKVQQQQPLPGLNADVKFCCCISVSPNCVRVINYVTASLLLVYAGINLCVNIALSTSDCKEGVEKCPNYVFAVWVFVNFFAYISGKGASYIISAFIISTLFYLTPGGLMIVAALKFDKLSALLAIILLGICMGVNALLYFLYFIPFAIIIYIAPGAVFAGVFCIFVVLTLLLTAIFAAVAAMNVIKGNNMLGQNYGGGIMGVPYNNMMDQRQSNVMSQIGSPRSSVRSNVMNQTVMSPTSLQ